MSELDPATPSPEDAAAEAAFDQSLTQTLAEIRQRRRRRLSRVKKAIQHGDYENALKVSVAADRVLEQLLREGPKAESR